MAATKKSCKKSIPRRVSGAKYDGLLQASLKQQEQINQMTSENETMGNALVKAQEENRALKSQISSLAGKISIIESLKNTYHDDSKRHELLIKAYRVVVIDMGQSTEVVPSGE